MRPRDGDGALFNFWWLDVPASVNEGEGAVEGEGEGDDFPVAVGI